MGPIKNTPAGWPRISSAIYYQDPSKMIDWLCAAYGFKVRLKVEGENGRIEHSELTYGDGLIMVGGERTGSENRWGIDMKSPASLSRCNTQGLMVFVDDVDAHCAYARAAGATIAEEPALHDYGAEYWADRSYGAIDPEGHLWWFTQRLRG
jgi:uncharacterized glyoxalase superfamily protein PhnB